jgi:hypothetical protein
MVMATDDDGGAIVVRWWQTTWNCKGGSTFCHQWQRRQKQRAQSRPKLWGLEGSKGGVVEAAVMGSAEGCHQASKTCRSLSKEGLRRARCAVTLTYARYQSCSLKLAPCYHAPARFLRHGPRPTVCYLLLTVCPHTLANRLPTYERPTSQV